MPKLGKALKVKMKGKKSEKKGHVGNRVDKYQNRVQSYSAEVEVEAELWMRNSSEKLKKNQEKLVFIIEFCINYIQFQS